MKPFALFAFAVLVVLVSAPTNRVSAQSIPVADSWNWAVKPSSDYEITQDFGTATFPGKENDYHPGVDISKISGKTEYSPVYAAANGRVSYLCNSATEETDCQGFGKAVLVSHILPDGAKVTSFYGHLQVGPDMPIVGKDVDVIKGETVIGYIADQEHCGDVCNAPHLHFGIRKGHFGEPGFPTSRWGYFPLADSQEFAQWLEPVQVIQSPLSGASNANTAPFILLQDETIKCFIPLARFYVKASQPYELWVDGIPVLSDQQTLTTGWRWVGLGVRAQLYARQTDAARMEFACWGSGAVFADEYTAPIATVTTVAGAFPTPAPTAILPAPTLATLPTATALATTPPIQDEEAEWEVYELPEEGLAISLPSKWQRIEMDAETLEASLEALEQENPEFGKAFGAQARQLLVSGVRFFGFDLSLESMANGFATNVNVLEESLPYVVSLDVYIQFTLGQLENFPNIRKPIQHERVILDGGEAEVLEYQIELATPDGVVRSGTIHQYVFLRESDAYIVTCSTLTEFRDKYAPTCRDIGNSFRFLR